MGERLLMAIRDAGWKRPVWLYHHWLGTKPYFIEAVAAVYLDHIPTYYGNKFRQRPDGTKWVRGFLNYADDMQITDEYDDRNYMAAIIIDKHVTAVWVELSKYNFKDAQDMVDFQLKFAELVSKEYPSGYEYGWAEKNIVKPLNDLIKYLPHSIIKRLDEPVELKQFIQEGIDEYETTLNHLHKNYPSDVLMNHPYFAKVIEHAKQSVEYLRELLARTVTYGLE